jgi:hypothetical protein
VRDSERRERGNVGRMAALGALMAAAGVVMRVLPGPGLPLLCAGVA